MARVRRPKRGLIQELTEQTKGDPLFSLIRECRERENDPTFPSIRRMTKEWEEAGLLLHDYEEVDEPESAEPSRPPPPKPRPIDPLELALRDVNARLPNELSAAYGRALLQYAWKQREWPRRFAAPGLQRLVDDKRVRFDPIRLPGSQSVKRWTWRLGDDSFTTGNGHRCATVRSVVEAVFRAHAKKLPPRLPPA